MKKNIVIAIDGPAASGKSTTAKSLAKKLKFLYIDTGAMYRACGLEAIKKNVSLNDKLSLKSMMQNINLEIKYSADGNKIFLDGEDVTKRIREADVTKMSSEIAVIDIVREQMTKLQREIGEQNSIIMDGRDIGTVVFPDADYKFFMEADVQTRALRRQKEYADKGIKVDLQELISEMKWRDENDSNRDIAPLKKAKDAIVIDTTNLSFAEQVEKIYETIKR